jgi:hypothetical protein
MAARSNHDGPLISIGIFLAGALLLTGAIIAGNGVLVVVALLLVLFTGTLSGGKNRQ